MESRSIGKYWILGFLATVIIGFLVWHKFDKSTESAAGADIVQAPYQGISLDPTVGVAPSDDLLPLQDAESVHSVEWSYPAEPIRREFDALMNGEDEIDAFILRHLKRAESGDENSAIYVAEAMRYCFMELKSVEMTRTVYGIEATNANEVSEAIMDNLIGKPEFYRREALLHIDRAIACERLGWSAEYHLETADQWEQFAREKEQPLAIAREASFNAREMTPEQLVESKLAIRNAMSQSHDLRVLLYASIVASTSTGSDFEFERLAWALLSCEYESCDGLNYLYRGTCEIMTLQGSHICSEDMTDLDYLFRKYPSQFDAARARASEYYDAIKNEQWELVGLR